MLTDCRCAHTIPYLIKIIAKKHYQKESKYFFVVTKCCTFALESKQNVIK